MLHLGQQAFRRATRGRFLPRWRSRRAASETVTHGSWIIVALALGTLAIGMLAVPQSPVHHWIACHVDSITGVTGSYASSSPCSGVGLATPVATQAISGPPTIPSANGSTLAPGWSTNAFLDNTAGGPYILLNRNGTYARYTFTVPSSSNRILTYGIPSGGWLNNGNSMQVEINGTVVATLSGNYAGGSTASQDTPYWSYAFGSGTYTLTFQNTSTNSDPQHFMIYGLWASN